MSREPSVATIREIAKRHRPRGWKVRERKPRGDVLGYALFQEKVIECPPLVDREALAVYLHEVGHVQSRHMLDDSDVPVWQWEYEAETYAVGAMRAEGIAFPRHLLKDAKLGVRIALEADKDAHPSDEVLKFAYGKMWRAKR